MINSIGAMQTSANAYATQQKQQSRPAGVLSGAAETTSVDMNKLFSPSELQTLQNMKAYGEENGASSRYIRHAEIYLVAARLGDRSAGMKETIGNQIKGSMEGYGKGKEDLAFLQNLYKNWDSLNGLDLKA